MSHIAAALAKSKGKKVEAPPGTLVPPALPAPVLPMPVRAPAPAAAAAAAAPKKFPLPLVLGGGLTVLVLAAAAWFFLKPAAGPAETPAVVAAKPAVPASVAKPPALPPPAAAPVVTAPVPATPARPAVVTPPPVTGSPDIALLQEQVAKFSVTVRKGGTDQRAVINGKTYVPGDRVADALTLQEVLGDRIILRDDSGHLYTK